LPRLQAMAAELQNVQFWEASVPAGLRPTPAQTNGGYLRTGRGLASATERDL